MGFYFFAFPFTKAESKKLKSSVLGLGLTTTGAATTAAVAATGATATVGSNCPGKQWANVAVGCLDSQ